jgi:quercetin dioxygenase-like cupin family protein
MVSPDGGEQVGRGPLGMRILEDGSNTGQRLGVVEVRLAPGVVGPPQHVHREHDETFYVVSGAVRFFSGDQQTELGPGGLVTAPIGAPHSFGNPDPATEALLLCTVTPHEYIDYFRELRGVRADANGLDRDALAELMSRYATELYT